MLAQPPHILVTTPESLYLLLTSGAAARLLRSGAHRHRRRDPRGGARQARLPPRALAGAARGARARARPRCASGSPPRSSPIEEIGRFLVGTARPLRRWWTCGARGATSTSPSRCRAIELDAVAHQRAVGGDLRPDRRAGARAPHHARVRQHPAAGRAGGAPARPSGWATDAVAAHHGSLSKERRLAPSSGSRRASCARWWPPRRSSSASTSAGRSGRARSARRAASPRSCSASARSGHALAACPRAASSRSPATSWWSARRWCAAVPARQSRRDADPRVAARRARAADRGDCAAARTWARTRLFALVRRACALPRPAARASSTRWWRCSRRASRRAARPRRARSTATASTACCKARRGARARRHHHRAAPSPRRPIPGRRRARGACVGTVDEDCAVESMAGDIFLLGNERWQIRRVEAGRVRVEDAHGAPPRCPSGTARRRDGPRSCRRRSRRCAKSWSRCSTTRRARCAGWWRSAPCPRRAPRRWSRYLAAAPGRAGRAADAEDRHRRALLRRGGRHAAGGARALRRPA